MVAARRPHVGGQQLPLLVPESLWTPPASVPSLRGVREIAIDTETRDEGLSGGVGPGWATGNGWLSGVSLAWAGGRCYLPLRHADTECLDRAAIGGLLRELWQDPDVRLVFMNAPYDLGWIWREFGLLPPRESGRIDDIGLMAVMVDENRPRDGYSLDSICHWVGLPGKDETLLLEALNAYGYPRRDEAKRNMWRLPARYTGQYAEQDASETLEAATRLRPRLLAEKTDSAYRTEADLIACCMEMRRRGVRVDTEWVERAQDHLLRERDNVLTELSKRAGRRIEIEHVRSWRHMAALCDAEGVPYPTTQPKKQKDGSMRGGGTPSFSATWMMRSEHWLPRMANMADRMTDAAEKFLGTFILNYAHNGRLHPNINQFRSEDGGTRSHRFSYSDPPLQQAPGSKMESVDDIGKEIVGAFRGAFLPEEGELWCSPDYSQQEYRLIVHVAVVAGLKRAEDAANRYRSDPKTDFHNLVVELTGLIRRNAKDCNFAKAFGAGIPKFALMINKSEAEAADIMGQYDEQLPFVREEGELCKRLADKRGYIRLIDGARIHYNLWEPAYREKNEPWQAACPRDVAEERWKGRRLRRAFTHKAMNNLIQGSAARQTKIAMLAMWHENIVPMLQMHDELPTSCDCPEKGHRIFELMRDAVPLTIPVGVDVEYGTSWGNAKKVETADKKVIYGATWNEARRLQKEGKWW